MGCSNNNPVECTFKKDDKIIWKSRTTQMAERPRWPGFVDISDNGKYIVFVNWGWYDEGGFGGISFYNGNGDLLKEISFGSGGKSGLRWIRKACISRDGNYYAIASDHRNNSKVTLYYVPKQNIVWNELVKTGFSLRFLI